VATTDQVRELAVGGPTSPITVLAFDFVGLWDPGTGERRVMRTFEHLGLDSHLAQLGDTYVFNDGHTIYRGKGDGPPTPWFTFRDDLELEAIDLAHERVAFKLDAADYIVDLVAKAVWGVSVPGFDEATCEAGMHVGFAPDGQHFAVDSPGAVTVFDMPSRKRIGDIDLPNMMQLKWDYLPTGEMLFAGPSELAIWDPKTKLAIGWKPPLTERPVEMGIDASGTELALGYANGSLLWADLAQLKLHSTHRDAVLKPATACAATKIKTPTIDQIIRY
jgi:hypothetical protein